MRGLLNRRVAIAVLIVGGLLAVALWPSAVPVDVGTVVRGPLVVPIEEEGRTRVRDRYVVSSPLAGRVLRIDLEPGDEIERGQVVARVRAEAPPLLDARTRAEAQAALDAARASHGRAQAEERRAKAALAQMQREVARLRELARNRVVSAQELEVKETEARTAEESANAAAFAVRAAASEVRRASVRLNPSPADPGRVVTVTAPIAGVVLKRMRESESVVPAGDPLLEIGNPIELEDRRGPAVHRCRPRPARRPRDDRGVGRSAGARRAESDASNPPASRRSRRSAWKSSASTSFSTSPTPRTHGPHWGTPTA